MIAQYDRVAVSAKFLRNVGVQHRFGAGNSGPVTGDPGKGMVLEIIGELATVWFEAGFIRTYNIGNLIHVRDITREADAAEHNRAYRAGEISFENLRRTY